MSDGRNRHYRWLLFRKNELDVIHNALLQYMEFADNIEMKTLNEIFHEMIKEYEKR